MTTAKYTKTAQKVKIGNRDAVVYKGQRGGRYIKKGGEFVALSKTQSGGAEPLEDTAPQPVRLSFLERLKQFGNKLVRNNETENPSLYKNTN